MKSKENKMVVVYQANVLNTRRIFVKEEGEGLMELKTNKDTFLNRYRGTNSVYVLNIWYTILEYLKPVILKDRRESFDYTNSWKPLILDIPLRNLKFNNENNYRKVKIACNVLLDTYFELEIENDEEKVRYFDNLFMRLKEVFIKKDGIIHFRMKFNPEMLNYILNLSKGYTKIDKAKMISLKTNYSKRIYELICQYRNIGWFLISFEKFKYFLNLGNKYPRMHDLKKNVLDPSIKDISIKTEFNVSYEIQKDTKSIEFCFNIIKSTKTLLLNNSTTSDKENKFMRILIYYVFNEFFEEGTSNEELFKMINTIRERFFGNNDLLEIFVNRVEFWEKQVVNRKREKRELYALVRHVLEEDYYLNIESFVRKFGLKKYTENGKYNAKTVKTNLLQKLNIKQ